MAVGFRIGCSYFCQIVLGDATLKLLAKDNLSLAWRLGVREAISQVCVAIHAVRVRQTG